MVIIKRINIESHSVLGNINGFCADGRYEIRPQSLRYLTKEARPPSAVVTVIKIILIALIAPMSDAVFDRCGVLTMCFFSN